MFAPQVKEEIDVPISVAVAGERKLFAVSGEGWVVVVVLVARHGSAVEFIPRIQLDFSIAAPIGHVRMKELPVSASENDERQDGQNSNN